MSKQIFSAIIRLEVELQENGYFPLEAQIGLLDIKGFEHVFMGADGMPNAKGCQLMSRMLADGLVANMLVCHQRGWRDSATHLRSIIQTLEKGVTSTETYRVKDVEIKRK